MADSDFPKRLERLGRKLLDEVEAWEQATRPRRLAAMERLAGKAPKRKRETKEERRRRKGEEKRAKAREEASQLAGMVFIVVAVVALGFAVLNPHFFWLVFVALGLGLAGASQLQLVQERERLEAGESLAPPSPHEVDALCDELLSELKASPEVVRSFLVEPEKTVASLRGTAKALDARRQQLASESPAERREELSRRRAELKEKQAATADETARRRLADALASLDAQDAALGELQAARDRIDSEYTSLLVLLQELRTRISVAKSAATPPQLEALKLNVQRLNDELSAITEALSYAPREPVASELEEGQGGRAERVPER